jgi:gluconate 5-dehydrogenase
MSLKISQLFNLQGKTALITGGSSGLGEGIALALGIAGAKIAIAARREEQLLAAAERLGREGVEVTCFTADLSVLEESTELSQKVLNKFGRVDILVNAAGINLREPFSVVSPKSWQEQLNVHLGAPFFLTQALAPHMKTHKWGRIINMPLCKALEHLETVLPMAQARAELCS